MASTGMLAGKRARVTAGAQAVAQGQSCEQVLAALAVHLGSDESAFTTDGVTLVESGLVN